MPGRCSVRIRDTNVQRTHRSAPTGDFETESDGRASLLATRPNVWIRPWKSTGKSAAAKGHIPHKIKRSGLHSQPATTHISGFTFTCPEVSTVSQGKTLEQDVKTLREATELYLEEFPQADLDRSLMTTFEVAGA